MKGLARRAAAAVTAATVLGAATGVPAYAGSAAGGGPDWAVTVSVPDFTYSVHDCEEVPAFFQAVGNIDGRWAVDLEVRLRGSGVATSWIYDYSYDSLTGSDSFYFCPGIDGPGVYDVTGTVEAGWDDAVAPVSLSFNVSAMPTTARITSAVTDGSYQTRFQGRVTALSAVHGDIGADPGGEVYIEAYKGGAWRPVEYTWPDQLGYFSVTAHADLPAGTAVRALYSGSDSTQSSMSPTSRTTGPRASVVVGRDSYRDRLKVDVNPNKGSGYWQFRVQKRTSTGTWKTLSTVYRTEGRYETKTINLPRGTYRVKVNPKFNYGGVTSAPVALRR